eukprot:GHVU01014115.1.p1 GENE.GHVU01014115.1~~GHVU01014115.1.p1  ORF type:complete len:1146 (+),score=147.82 GHVU01014115.1:72-3509(+)
MTSLMQNKRSVGTRVELSSIVGSDDIKGYLRVIDTYLGSEERALELVREGVVWVELVNVGTSVGVFICIEVSEEDSLIQLYVVPDVYPQGGILEGVRAECLNKADTRKEHHVLDAFGVAALVSERLVTILGDGPARQVSVAVPRITSPRLFELESCSVTRAELCLHNNYATCNFKVALLKAIIWAGHVRDIGSEAMVPVLARSSLIKFKDQDAAQRFAAMEAEAKLLAEEATTMLRSLDVLELEGIGAVELKLHRQLLHALYGDAAEEPVPDVPVKEWVDNLMQALVGDLKGVADTLDGKIAFYRDVDADLQTRHFKAHVEWADPTVDWETVELFPQGEGTDQLLADWEDERRRLLRSLEEAKSALTDWEFRTVPQERSVHERLRRAGKREVIEEDGWGADSMVVETVAEDQPPMEIGACRGPIDMRRMADTDMLMRPSDAVAVHGIVAPGKKFWRPVIQRAMPQPPLPHGVIRFNQQCGGHRGGANRVADLSELVTRWGGMVKPERAHEIEKMKYALADWTYAGKGPHQGFSIRPPMIIGHSELAVAQKFVENHNLRMEDYIPSRERESHAKVCDIAGVALGMMAELRPWITREDWTARPVYVVGASGSGQSTGMGGVVRGSMTKLGMHGGMVTFDPEALSSSGLHFKTQLETVTNQPFLFWSELLTSGLAMRAVGGAEAKAQMLGGNDRATMERNQRLQMPLLTIIDVRCADDVTESDETARARNHARVALRLGSEMVVVKHRGNQLDVNFECAFKGRMWYLRATESSSNKGKETFLVLFKEQSLSNQLAIQTAGIGHSLARQFANAVSGSAIFASSMETMTRRFKQLATFRSISSAPGCILLRDSEFPGRYLLTLVSMSGLIPPSSKLEDAASSPGQALTVQAGLVERLAAARKAPVVEKYSHTDEYKSDDKARAQVDKMDRQGLQRPEGASFLVQVSHVLQVKNAKRYTQIASNTKRGCEPPPLEHLIDPQCGRFLGSELSKLRKIDHPALTAYAQKVGDWSPPISPQMCPVLMSDDTYDMMMRWTLVNAVLYQGFHEHEAARHLWIASADMGKNVILRAYRHKLLELRARSPRTVALYTVAYDVKAAMARPHLDFPAVTDVSRSELSIKDVPVDSVACETETIRMIRDKIDAGEVGYYGL